MAEDFNKLRMTTRLLVSTEFQKQWQFRLEVDGAPKDFDLYVKDIAYGPVDVKTDEDSYGGVVMTWPLGLAPVRLSVTVRDNRDERIAHFFDEWVGKVALPDGTVGIPAEYLRKVRKYIVHDDSSETLSATWTMYPLTRGDISQSRETGDFLEFPVVFMQFATHE